MAIGVRRGVASRLVALPGPSRVTVCGVLVLALAASASAGSPGAAKGDPVRRDLLLVFDQPQRVSLDLRNFRTMRDVLGCRYATTPSLAGLDRLRASGSSQFSERALAWVLERIPAKNVVIVDVRQESHGFVNGQAVHWRGKNNWANRGKPRLDVQKEERRRLDLLARVGSTLLVRLTRDYLEPFERHRIRVRTVATEEDVCRARGVRYVRIPVSDISAPTDDEVERFVTMVRELEPDAWLHFHCLAGRPRTTTFLAMYDMMKNARRVSMRDILLRQHQLGGADLLVLPPADSFRYEPARVRLALLARFHEYCRTNRDRFATGWLSWIAAHRGLPAPARPRPARPQRPGSSPAKEALRVNPYE